MSILQVKALSHAFGEKALYTDADLALYKGEHMGVVGQNGAGKSTLLRLLLGELTPTGGQILWQRGLSIGHIDQHAALSGEETILNYLRTAFSALYQVEERLQALYLSMGADTPERDLRRAAAYQERLEEENFYGIDSEIARVAAGLGLSAIGMERRLSTLSGGQRTKAILAKLLLSSPDVLLLDEPTNFLDAEHIAWLSAYLRGFPGSFMIVSHDFAFLDAITDCICDIEFQTLRKYHGRYTEFVKQKTHLREAHQRRVTAQTRQVAKLEAYIAKNRVRTATARQAQSRIKQLEKIERLSELQVLPRPHIVFRGAALPASRALRAERLCVGYDRPLLPPLSFDIAGGEKVVVTGFNGIGKSTLLKTLVGQRPALGGGFSFHQGVRIGYFEQDLRWADGGQTPLSVLLEAYPNHPPKQLRKELARYGVRAEHVLRPIATLSGGEQNRVKLCRLSMRECNFLILDEPTNHLDAETKDALREALEAFPGSVLLVCHERAFYQGFGRRVIDIEALLEKTRLSR